jgi:acyl-CoA synthetase (AMP-forming)/AMP-acid ligase II
MAGGAWGESTMTVTGMPAGRVTVTQRLVGLGAARGDRAALVGGSAGWPGRPLSYASLGRILQAAAAGLARRGVRAQDVVGVHAPDAVSYVLAVHAVQAAGGVPCPLPYSGSRAALAGQLTDCGARLLITAGPLATAALSAADGSWVRQVISFDEGPGSTLFCSLLARGSQPPAAASGSDPALLLYLPGPDGTRSAAPLTHAQFATGLARLGDGQLFSGDDVVLAVPPSGDGPGYTMLVDLALLSGATLVASRAGDLPGAARRHGATAVIAPAGTPVPAALPLHPVTAGG